MSGQTGFNYEVMISRLHGGLCAFQSLRAHRRQRGSTPAAAPVTDAEERVMTPPPPACAVHTDDPGDVRVTGSLEPQAFVTVGGRVLPIFGDMSAVLGVTAPASPGQSSGEPPVPPRNPSAPELLTPATPAASAPAPTASALKLPLPTPPPRLGLVHGGHARPPASEPTPSSEQSAGPPPPATGDTHKVDAESAASPATAQVALDAATLAALLETRAQEEGKRLENIHAEHRVAVAILLQDHREELRARREADAARTAQLLREVLTEHRAELARSAQAHAEQLSQVLAQHQSAPQHEDAEDNLRAALIEQASLQRQANEDVADHIGALTSIVADLGQTVGMLAVATHEGKQGRMLTRPIFIPPPRVEPATATPAPAPTVDPSALVASPYVDSAAGMPTCMLSVDPPVAANSAASPSRTEPTAITPAAAATSSPGIEPMSHSPRNETPPAVRLCEAIAEEPPKRRPIHLTHAEEAAARARVSQAIDEDRDDDDLETVVDDDDPPRHRPLGPVTELERPDIEERDDD